MRQLDGRGACLDDRVCPAGMADDVGVRGELLVVGRPLGFRAWLAQKVRDVVVAHPAVAVPLRPAVADADAVNHPVAAEPVVLGLVDRPERVRPVAQVPAVELGRECAGHPEVEGSGLGVDGGEVPAQERVGLVLDGGHCRIVRALSA